MTNIIFNGYRKGEIKETTHSILKIDEGHSVVRTQSWWDGGAFVIRRAVVCQCGRRYTGLGMRPHYTHIAHQKVMRAMNTEK